MFKNLIWISMTSMATLALDCNLSTEKICGPGICLSNGECLYHEDQPTNFS